MKALSFIIVLLIFSSFIFTSDNEIIYDGLEAEHYHQKKTLFGNSLKASYKIASGDISKEISTESASPLILSYSIKTTVGKATILIERDGEVVWKKKFDKGTTAKANNCIIQLPEKSDYLITIGLEQATGEYNLKWKTDPKKIKNAR
ncbi:hypothetical protein [Tunicatimonas pelagia]|uniref:hypothetical protein n=1 Tax=Tunicatimonas pelagia TaxID=931531 RepID=UPI0026671F51|nr:hypothetical protein [Tunicatimonas pelagia]WKN45687.1 hypothetical protein P0M28_12040 [Tunicatimonas pelagia]